MSIILPLFLYVPVNSLQLEIYKHLKRKEFIVPTNYSGPLRIIYEENCGEKFNEKNKTYQFPQDGILILSAKEDGGLNHHYFYMNKNGEKIEILQVDLTENKKPIPSVSLIGFIEKNNTKYIDLYINNGNSVQYNFFGSNPKLDSLTTVKVNDCRKK